MNVNLFFKELRSSLKGSVIISLAVALYIAFSMSMYSMMSKNMATVTDLYSSIPESMRTAFNFYLNQWGNILGFYITYFIYFVPIIVGCYSVVVGAKLLSKEEQNKTAEFLLSRPISRGRIVSSKILSFLVHILGINLFVFLVALISCGLNSKWDFRIQSLVILHTYGFLMCVLFGVLGFFMTVLMKRAKASVGIGIGIVLGFYLFDMVIRVSGRLQFLLYLTPFKYLNLHALAENYGFEAWRLGVFLGASGLLIVLSFLFYRRKDILV